MNRSLFLILFSFIMIVIIGTFFLSKNFQSPNLQEEDTNGKNTPNEYVVVDTNQDNCYNVVGEIAYPSLGESFFGQDAQYVGSQPIYVDNEDGTITDLNTGLMWQKETGEKIKYSQAVAKVNTFKLAGFTDWRLPTIKELYSLMDFRGIDPSAGVSSVLVPFIDTQYFDFKYGDTSAGERIIDSQWITSSVYKSTVMNDQEGFFGVNFADGRIKCYPISDFKLYYVRYVRGSAYGLNNFVDNGDGTISDLNTGLTWQKEDSNEGMSWENALEYSENLEFANYTDWRLPNAKELQSIVDYSRCPDIADSAAIDPIFEISSITNEGGGGDYPFFWTSTTHIGSLNSGRTAVYVSFGRALGYWNGLWIDVHGAGAQRSDPKVGDPNDYPYGRGPQGDVIRIYNYVRCVRG